MDPLTIMSSPRLVSVFLFSTVLLGLNTFGAENNDFAWPKVDGTHRPWTRWWWPGSAVDKENLSRELKALADLGFGGVEITPIYGAKGA